MIDRNHPFYRPLWRRLAIVAFCFIWAMMELLIGSTGFGLLIGALGAYAAFMFFGRDEWDKRFGKTEARPSDEQP